MHTVFASWKYIFKNIWFVLPIVVVPAIFLAFSVDYVAVSALTRAFFSGDPRMGFLDFFRCFSLIRIDSLLGGIFSGVAFITLVVAVSFLLSLVEKHMRIGKRTLSGVGRQFGNVFFSALAEVFFYALLYEIWCVVLSALLFVVSQVKLIALVYVVGIVVFALMSYVLFYAVAAFYLWLPCRLMTGFRAYDAFLYSYRLMVGVRGKLLFAYFVAYAPAILALAGASLLPGIVFRAVLILLYAFMILDFCIRMETVYFETDKLDREDEIRSYREIWR